jgi:hypothetical protein
MDIFEKASLKYYHRNIFMSILLLVPVLYSIQLLFESKWIKSNWRYALELLSIALALVYYFSLPNAQLIALYFSQFWLYLSISVLMSFMSIKQFIKQDDIFWHFNVSLISRANITSLYTSAILGGTGAALGAIDMLFKTRLIEHQEIRIVILTLWLFLPLFFLSGVPLLNNPASLLSYKPKWLKNIGLYVLLPLTTVYLGILYAYSGKILAQFKLPDGRVSYLVLSFAAFGIASLILVFPFQRDENSKWSYWFSRSFYFLQFPLLILLSIAIHRRVLDYGITFRRYYVIALAVWLLFITLFMVFRKNRHLVVIPFSLFLFALASSLGPWGAYQVAFRNQKERLMTILSDNGLIESGRLSISKKDLSSKVKGDLSSIAKYMFDYGKLQSFAYLSTSNDTLTPKSFMKQIGIEYKERWDYEQNENRWFFYNCRTEPSVINTQAYPYFVKFNLQVSNPSKPTMVKGDSVSVEYLEDNQSFRFINSKRKSSELPLKAVLAQFDFQKTGGDRLVGSYKYNDSLFEVICFFNTLQGNQKPDGITINQINVDFLISLKR